MHVYARQRLDLYQRFENFLNHERHMTDHTMTTNNNKGTFFSGNWKKSWKLTGQVLYKPLIHSSGKSNLDTSHRFKHLHSCMMKEFIDSSQNLMFSAFKCPLPHFCEVTHVEECHYSASQQRQHCWHPTDVVWLDFLSLPDPETKCHLPQQQCRCQPAPFVDSKEGNQHVVTTKYFLYFGIYFKIIVNSGNGSKKTSSLFLPLLLWLASCGHMWVNTEMNRVKRNNRSELDDVAEHTQVCWLHRTGRSGW